MGTETAITNKIKLLKTPRKLRLITLISTHQHLRKAWEALNKSNPDSRGLSMDTIKDFHHSLEAHITEIRKLLKTGKYKFNEVRPVLIPKNEEGKFRPLRVADISDRLVQKAIAIKLEELVSEKYKLNNDCSFAYQKDRRVEDAIKKAIEHYKNGNIIILEADIKKFFDNVNRKKLLQKVYADLPDRSLNKLLSDALSQSVGDLSRYEEQHHHYFLNSIQGIPQGNCISPLLANIYLSDFDQRMIKEGLNLVRYADDFIILCKSYHDAHKALQIAKEEIEVKLDLELHPLPNPPHLQESKTRILDPVLHRFSFLSIRFDGTSVWVDPSKIKDLREKINLITDISNYRNDPKYQGLITILKKLKNLLEGWLSAFKYVDVDRDFAEIDDHINYKLLGALIKLEFKIKTSHQEVKKIKSTGKKVSQLTLVQRKNSGIPLCKDFLDTIKRHKIVM